MDFFYQKSPGGNDVSTSLDSSSSMTSQTFAADSNSNDSTGSVMKTAGDIAAGAKKQRGAATKNRKAKPSGAAGTDAAGKSEAATESSAALFARKRPPSDDSAASATSGASQTNSELVAASTLAMGISSSSSASSSGRSRSGYSRDSAGSTHKNQMALPLGLSASIELDGIDDDGGCSVCCAVRYAVDLW
jgi:hypothetical protein